jgi:putative transposase
MCKPYKTKSHSKFLITYHIIFVVKYRKKLLKKYGDDVKQLISEVAKPSDFNITEMEVDKDHIHLIVESVPKISPLQIIKKLKQETTVNIWKLHPELKEHFWKEKTFWSDGYFCCSIGNASIETVRKYIKSQG